MSITIDLAIPDDLVTRQDAAFYVGFPDHVATVTSADQTRSINVRCVGEMRVLLWKSEDCERTDKNIVAVIRDADALIRAGITNDEQLAAAEDRLEWMNNAWFELFDSDENADEWDDVYHEVDEAIQAAIDILSAA